MTVSSLSLSTASWRREVALFLALLACYAYFFPRWADWNQNSRLDLTVAIVDDHTLTIDRLVGNTGDYATDNGHFYSDKAPGVALLGVPVYAVFEKLVPASLTTRWRLAASDAPALQGTLRPGGSGLEPEKVRFFLTLVVVAFVIGVVPAAGLGVLFFRVAGHLGLGTREALAATILYALATSAFPYANTLVGHQTAAFLLFAAFAALLAIRRGRLRPHWLVLVGFLLGLAAIVEYQTVLIGTMLSLYALWVAAGRDEGAASPARASPSVAALLAAGGRLALGALPSLVALVAYDLAAFGTPLPVGYFHSTLWADVHQIGFVSLTYPHLDALLGITVGVDRGLFFLSPYLLFAIPGYVVLGRSRAQRPELLTLLAAPLAYLLFNSSSAMWQGGFAVGPRYLVPSLPFLGLVAGVGLATAWRRVGGRPFVALAALWSFGAVWAETIAGQSFPDYTPNPLFALSAPRLLAGDVARNLGMLLGLSGWRSLAPLLVIVLVLIGLAALPTTAAPTPAREVPFVRKVERWA